ncbi:hypothetical protein FHG64_01595 [Antarcticibacterium flavum]|uniref:Aspartate kinase n=1 Tax=Antarcticibacterium flavum TaxID=2058175 RepID=A0A5B7WYA2_9FLAO|nr:MULTISPECIES: hypothetical protein [Antarcticibacterium]MCM4158940.1 hypothetical protein [Antarcticibacterium sp. W02-3]QCY68194.1 hypothetical protein FHG64_01595 [Antarcticibacterium flavum]
MNTITSVVHNILRHQPFLDDALAKDLINFSALAAHLQPDVEKELRKPVQQGSIIMALRRYAPKKNLLKNTSFREMGDIVVRSGITEYTYLNSKTILSSQAKLLNIVKDELGVYLNYSSNYQESNILVSAELKETVAACFEDEILVSVKSELSSLTIALPKNSAKSVGLYFYIFKLLAYEGIPVFEMISTSNYFALFLEKEYVNQAFLLLNEIKIS